MGQPTEKPVIVEALDLTFRTIEERIKRYRNLVISVVIVTAVSLLLAFFYHQWLFVAGLILLVPLAGRFSVADSRSVRRWRAQILGMSRARNLNLRFYVKTVSELHKISPRTLHHMLATIPLNQSHKANQETAALDLFDTKQQKLEKKTMLSVVLLTATLICAAATTAFRSGILLAFTIVLTVLLAIIRWQAIHQKSNGCSELASKFRH